ncbi:sigma-70 family RNA polymerase sigma factor, partial [bacterium]|nr:sigma-70 family RNA polymerase sigma factor [bacterium]
MRHLVSTLLRLADRPAAGSDPELLARFARDRDEAAFAALVDRHGPMVLGVARRLLRDPHAADDVFQATFLALARSAAALRRPGGLPAWLYRTAVRAAVKLARTRRPLALAADRPAAGADPLDALTARELLAAVDDEIRRLPAALRAAVVACGLEGRSQDEAARLLGWTAGQVRGRL